MAFAVDDRFQGKGLGTIAARAPRRRAPPRAGFTRFQATTLPDNAAMLEVFRDSGFEIRSKSAGGCIDVQLSLTPSFEGVAVAEAAAPRRRRAASLAPMLEPRAVAVVGASRDPTSIGRRIVRRAASPAGSRGPHLPDQSRTPARSAACGRTRRVRDAPRGVDLAVIAVPRDAVLAVVDDCAAAGVKSLVVITAGFAEAGDEGRALQEQLVEKVRGYGMRMVGPNCMGLLNATPERPAERVVLAGLPAERRTSRCRRRAARSASRFSSWPSSGGVGLSTFVSVGNKADVSSNDLLRVLGGRPAHARHPALPRVVRQPAALRAARAPHRPRRSRSSP